MIQLLGLVGFSFVSSITPGPNNILLWASGATFGLRRTVPHVLGTAVGIGAMALAAAAGIAALLAAVPVLGIGAHATHREHHPRGARRRDDRARLALAAI